MLKKFLQKWLEIPTTAAPAPAPKKKDERYGVPDVPRTAMGWPVFGPEYFTLPQLIIEARKWRGDYLPGTVGANQWKKYTDELIRRGYSTRLEIEHGFLPDEVHRRETPSWYWQLEGL